MIKAGIMLLALHLAGAFSFREQGPAALFPYPTAAWDDTFFGALHNPSYLPGAPGPLLYSAYSRPYGLDDLHAGTIALLIPAGQAAALASWHRFGIPEYTEETFRVDAGVRACPWFAFGAGASLHRLSINAGGIVDDYSFSEWRASVLVTPVDGISFSFLQENLVAFASDRESTLRYPSWSAGITLSPAQGIFLSWNYNREMEGHINTASLTAHLFRFLSVRAGYSRETSSMAAAMNVLCGNVGASYALRYHRYLGCTHTVAATLSMEALSFSPARRGALIPRRAFFLFPEQKTDINRSTIEELKAVPGMSDEMAERIMRYRSLFGPLDREALRRIGMSERETGETLPHLKGFAATESQSRPKRTEGPARRHHYDRERKSAMPFMRAEKRRELFQRLVKAGVKSLTALRISEDARMKSPAEVQRMLESHPGIDEHTRAKAGQACKGF